MSHFGSPWVVKDDRLAAGKGVVVTDDLEVARAHALTLLDGGHPVLLESYLDGPEFSLFCLVDTNRTVVPLLPAQDFKRVGEGDVGPNTGGMGAYAPLPWAPESLHRLRSGSPALWKLPTQYGRVAPEPRSPRDRPPSTTGSCSI